MIALGAAVLSLAGATPAAAEEQPAILKAYGLDWIERIKEEAWPQPKTERPVICLLDTGVAVTPDTPADNPEGPIVARLSVEDPEAGMDGHAGLAPTSSERGLPQGTSWVHLHGTRMAGILAAPRNGTGTVGVFPQGRIVSVRVTVGTETHIAPAELVRGIRHCRRWAVNAGVDLASVVMAESQYDQRVSDLGAWQKAASAAAESGGVLVAAMGNSPDAERVAPLAATSVIAVGAGSDDGTLCPNVPAALGQLVGPGCSTLIPSWYEGSSSATAAVGAFAAAIATRQPALPVSAVRSALSQATAQAGSYRRIAGQVAQSAFVGLINDRVEPESQNAGLVISRDAPSLPGSGPAEESTQPQIRLWRPGVKLRWKDRKLVVARTAHSGRGVLLVRTTNGTTPLRMVGRRATFSGVRRARTVTVWAEASDGKSWRSLSRRVKVSS